MSAMSLQQLAGGRFRLGVGASGPQVMEGWHGVRFRRPVQATRETIEIIRMISRGDRLDYHGQVYDLPLPDSQGRAIRSMAAPVHVPVYVAAIGPANLRLTGELADGWLGNTFMPESAEVFLGPLRAGAQRAGRTLADLDPVGTRAPGLDPAVSLERCHQPVARPGRSGQAGTAPRRGDPVDRRAAAEWLLTGAPATRGARGKTILGCCAVLWPLASWRTLERQEKRKGRAGHGQAERAGGPGDWRRGRNRRGHRAAAGQRGRGGAGHRRAG
jgi:alkanesulfonate monooxygenase SsuD/methylene tetrahydromethanopterin reductase-like flavin-dependent oxidoreductase (luciferase family)